MKLDLACGLRREPGFLGVDIVPGPCVDRVVDLWRFPWPWESDSVDEARCSHHLEHVPQAYWTPPKFFEHEGKTITSIALSPSPTPHDETSQDLIAGFMDEAYRVLKKDARFTVIVPSGQSANGYADFTHRRYFFPESFYYFSKKWREENGVSHYNIACDFEVQSITGKRPSTEKGRVDAQFRADHFFNITSELEVVLIARKP